MVHNGPAYEQQDLPTKDFVAALGGGRGDSDRGTRTAQFHSSSTEMIRGRSDHKPPLHNFTLPRLGWGCQKLMRFGKGADCPMSPLSSSLISEGIHQSSDRLPCGQARLEEEEDGEGIAAVRVKLMVDLGTETDKFKEELLKGKEDGKEKEGEPAGKLAHVAAMAGRREEEEVAKTRPWNLRTRRAMGRAQGGRNGSPARKAGKAASPEKEKREKFSLALKKKEIEEDFMRMTGHRPHRRPNKRPKAVQKQLDMLFPGLWLTEVTADAYKVVEVPDNRKR